MKYGRIKQRNSQDTSPNVTAYSYRPVEALKNEYFLTIFVPYDLPFDKSLILENTESNITNDGVAEVNLKYKNIKVSLGDSWSVSR